MFRNGTKEVVFPDLIPGNRFDGKTWEKNSKYSGIKKLHHFNLTTNTFYGGRVEEFFFIREYGVYACKEKGKDRIIGFYIPDPKILTANGKKAIEKYYDGKDVIFALRDEIPDDYLEKKELKEEALSVGIDESIVDSLSAKQVRALVARMKDENKIEAEQPKRKVNLPKAKTTA